MSQEIERVGDPASEFDEIRLKALRIAKHVLDLPNDPERFKRTIVLGKGKARTTIEVNDPDAHHKRLVLQARMAESMIADAIKLDEAALKHQTRSEALDLIRERMDKVKLPQKP